MGLACGNVRLVWESSIWFTQSTFLCTLKRIWKLSTPIIGFIGYLAHRSELSCGSPSPLCPNCPSLLSLLYHLFGQMIHKHVPYWYIGSYLKKKQKTHSWLYQFTYDHIRWIYWFTMFASYHIYWGNHIYSGPVPWGFIGTGSTGCLCLEISTSETTEHVNKYIEATSEAE